MKDLQDSIYFRTMLETAKDTWNTHPERREVPVVEKKRDKDKVKKRKIAKNSRRRNR